ncbi:substrate-binding domain-containing protein [Streptomyces sp. enrichment culture]|uniref:substrate-binding domain-containing protein n=1 Tax=Streptomyces sp. enrichment culture TaxID=1795815 RepID=UPI003F54D76D
MACATYACATAPDAARRTAERLLRARPAPTGVAVRGEPLLEPLAGAFEELGVRVPGDVSVVALGPDPLTGPAGRPPVTSVTVPAAALGARAVELLMRRPRVSRCRPPPCCRRG